MPIWKWVCIAAPKPRKEFSSRRVKGRGKQRAKSIIWAANLGRRKRNSKKHSQQKGMKEMFSRAGAAPVLQTLLGVCCAPGEPGAQSRGARWEKGRESLGN